jgi:Protein of unknown function (DUF3050)
MTNTFLSEVQKAGEPLAIHELYKNVSNLASLRAFMEHHVFAVYDFMSLVKTLQVKLTCTNIPWYPVGSANTRFLINEIVCGEESDVDEHGNRASHFEMYLQAMEAVGANTTAIRRLLELLQNGLPVQDALDLCGGPAGAIAFSKHTFNTIATEPIGVIAAIFAFGREDLIPKMFIALLDSNHFVQEQGLNAFRYYLQRHIEVDGGHHSQLAWEMTRELLGNNTGLWNKAELAVKESLSARVALWDSVVKAIG